MSVSNCCTSQGSVATYLRCSGNYYTRFVGNFFLFTAVQEILKSVKIWQSYRQSLGPQFFFRTQGILLTQVLFSKSSGGNSFNNFCAVCPFSRYKFLTRRMYWRRESIQDGQAPRDATVWKRFFRDNFVIFRRRWKNSIFWNQWIFLHVSICKFSIFVMITWPLFGTLQGPISPKCLVTDSPV